MPLPRRAANPLVPWIVGVLSGWLGLELYERYRDLSSGAERRLLTEVHELVSTTYVDPLEEDELVDRSLRGLVGSLDPYSHYYAPDELARLDRETSGVYRGVGVLLRPPATDGQILFALPDSPAHRAGLAPGDRFVEVAGRDVAAMELGELQQTLRGTGDGPVPTVVEALGGERHPVELVPEPVVDPTVRHARMLVGAGDTASPGVAGTPADTVGYVALASFTKRTPDELRDELAALEALGMRELVLDLRANPGGILDAAVEIANLFVDEGLLVTTRSRAETREYRAEPDAATYAGLPLAVLIDGESASASEVLAGALQDHRAGVLVGTPTYGKGLVQTLSRFGEDRAVVKLTTSRYYTPTGRRIDRGSPDPAERGISPDLLVPLEDEAKARVQGFLRGYSPPRDQRAALAAWERELGETLVEPPPVDSQLEAAASLLRGAPLAWAEEASGAGEETGTPGVRR